MNLTERHIIKKGDIYFQELDDACFASKNLYNSILYIWRQAFIKKEKISNSEIYSKIKGTKDFKSLPQNVSAQVFLQFCQVINSFFQSLKSYKENPSNFNGAPGLPKYKEAIKGRNLLTYNARVLPQRDFKKDGKVRLTGLGIKIFTRIKPKQVRIIPRNKEYIIELIYDKECKEQVQSVNYAGLDLGVNNLAVLSFNNHSSIIINGRPLKSINQFYNKKKAQLQSKLTKKHTSNAIVRLTNKRNKKVQDYLHKSSRFIVNQLVSKNISTIVIGKNKNWKQDISIGKKNNQNFVNIPHARFIEMIKYKCELEGISVILTDESYTSKCSFIDNEKIGKHKIYLGMREKRGLFISKEKRKINADLNGSLNILKKVFPNCFANGIEGLLVSPLVHTIKF